MTTSPNKKSKPLGCLGFLSLLLLWAVPHLLQNFQFRHSGPMSPEESSVLRQEAEQIRSQFKAGECDRLYQDHFRVAYPDISADEFAEACSQISEDYQRFESAELVEATCDKTTYPFQELEFANCSLTYRIAQSDGTTTSETYDWYLENGDRQLTNLYWPAPPTSELPE